MFKFIQISLKKILLAIRERTGFFFLILYTNLTKQSIKNKLYPKSTKVIDALEQKKKKKKKNVHVTTQLLCLMRYHN